MITAQVAAAVAEVAEEDQDEARGAAVANAQMGETDAITAARATILLASELILLMRGEGL